MLISLLLLAVTRAQQPHVVPCSLLLQRRHYLINLVLVRQPCSTHCAASSIHWWVVPHRIPITTNNFDRQHIRGTGSAAAYLISSLVVVVAAAADAASVTTEIIVATMLFVVVVTITDAMVSGFLSQIYKKTSFCVVKFFLWCWASLLALLSSPYWECCSRWNSCARDLSVVQLIFKGI